MKSAYQLDREMMNAWFEWSEAEKKASELYTKFLEKKRDFDQYLKQSLEANNAKDSNTPCN